MSIDNEIVWEEIRREVKLEKITPDKFTELWQKTIGNNRTVVMERFKNVGGELEETKMSTLEKTGYIADNESGIMIMSWQEKGFTRTLPINSDDFFIGAQDHESGEKSFVLSHSSIDKESGKNRQTVRRFTAAKMQTATSQL